MKSKAKILVIPFLLLTSHYAVTIWPISKDVQWWVYFSVSAVSFLLLTWYAIDKTTDTGFKSILKLFSVLVVVDAVREIVNYNYPGTPITKVWLLMCWITVAGSLAYMIFGKKSIEASEKHDDHKIPE